MEVCKGRMFVVDSDTINYVREENILYIKAPEPTNAEWLKTIADIMADMLQMEIGDYAFLWETKRNDQKSRIYGVYRIISKPFYECESDKQDYPFRIHVEKAYDFKNPIDEYEVLNNPYIKNSMWTMVGKKIAGKPRGTTSISMEEIKALIILLKDKNENFKFIPFDDKRIKNVEKPLQIDYKKTGENPKVKNLSDFHPNDLSYLWENSYYVRYEKILETIFNQEMSKRNEIFFKQIGVDVNKVIWFSNYLPYSIERSEMDYVIIQAEEKNIIDKIFLIEFQRGKVNINHIRRAYMYSRWINETLGYGTNITKPIIVCEKYIKFKKDKSVHKSDVLIDNVLVEYEKEEKQKLEIYTYDFSVTPLLLKKCR